MPATQRELYFYQGRRMSTTIGGASARVVWGASIACAQLNIHDPIISVLQCDQANTVMKNGRTAYFQIYTPYGFSKSQEPTTLVTFVGQRRDKATGNYPLGNGQRDFNPRTMRFNQPDALSPFGKGGINGYSYCQSDPVNRNDPGGRFWERIRNFLTRTFGRRAQPQDVDVEMNPLRPSAPTLDQQSEPLPSQATRQIAASSTEATSTHSSLAGSGSTSSPATVRTAGVESSSRIMSAETRKFLLKLPVAYATQYVVQITAAEALGNSPAARGVAAVFGVTAGVGLVYVLNRKYMHDAFYYARNLVRR